MRFMNLSPSPAFRRRHAAGTPLIDQAAKGSGGPMSISRREFLQVGKLCLVALFPTIVASCHDYAAGDRSTPHETLGPEGVLGQSFGQILALAARAPSGHNTQPWTVRILDQSTWFLGIEASRRLPAVDPSTRETVLSLGAFLESLIFAARHYGLQITYRILASSPADREIVQLSFHNVGPAPQRLEELRRRRTLRTGFCHRDISAMDVASVVGGEANFQYFPSSSTGAKYISEATVEANKRQAFREDAKAELASWIRWSSSDADRYLNGLTPATMEIDGVSGWYVRHFYDRRSAMSNSFRDAAVKLATQRVREGGGWLVLASQREDIAALVETGRQCQRMWQRLRDKGIAIHPMTQVLEEMPWRDQVATHLSLGGTPQFLFRIGYVDKYPEPVSLRMPPDWFTK